MRILFDQGVPAPLRRHLAGHAVDTAFERGWSNLGNRALLDREEADRSGDLRRFIEEGKKIIISTVQKFPFILDEIGNQQRVRRFAIIIDEAHSSQGGRTSTAMTWALSPDGEADENAEIDPGQPGGGGHWTESEMDRLSNILKAFNELFGDIAWEDSDRVRDLITKTIPSRVAADAAFRNARQNSDEANARIEHDKALLRVMTSLMKDDTELYKQYVDNASFKRWMTDRVFELACEQTAAP